MSSAFRIDYVEAALLQLLNTNLPPAYGALLGVATVAVNIDSLGDDDFNADGQLVLEPPSVRVRFLGVDYDPARDNQRLTYQSPLEFEVLSFESSLRDMADERRQTLVLVQALLDQFSGARLNLTDGTKTEPILLVDTRLVEGNAAGVDQLFSTRIEIRGFAQFSGANANPN